LSLTGAPNGVTSGFNPATVTGSNTTSTLTLTIGAAVAPGDYNLTITGTATGQANKTVGLTLTVPAPAGSYTLAVAPNPKSIAAGSNGTVTVTLNRTNFAGDVALSVTGAPNGVSTSFDPATVTGGNTTSTLTITVGAAVAEDDYTLTIKGTATGQTDKTVALTLTVTAAPSYTLTATDVTTQAGQNGTSTVTIARTGGFNGTVNLTVQTAPSGVTGSFDPAAVTGVGTSSTLTLTVGAGVATGNYPVTIKGTATGQTDKTTTIQLTVSPPSSGSIHWDFSACGPESRPVWLAVQDGNGAWTRVVGASNVYSFDIASSTGGVAWVTQDGGNSVLAIRYLGKTEIVGASFTGCPTGSLSGKDITGTTANVAATDLVQISLANAHAGASGVQLGFTLHDVDLGTFDLVAWRRSLTTPGTGDKAFITRDINTNTTSDVGTIDFAAAGAITPEAGDLTLTGGAGGEQFVVGMNYATGGACTLATLYGALPVSATTIPFLGIPAANQRATDYHIVSVNSFTTTSSRSVLESFHTFGDKSVALPSALPATSPTALTGPYKRLQYQITLPSDLLALATFSYTDDVRTVVIIASAAFLGGGALNLSTPDLSGVAGWDNSWVPASNATVSWSAMGSGGSPASLCSNGARVVSSSRIGQL
jgi:hypothetical protein